jgi:hypothetical protein
MESLKALEREREELASRILREPSEQDEIQALENARRLIANYDHVTSQIEGVDMVESEMRSIKAEIQRRSSQRRSSTDDTPPV